MSELVLSHDRDRRANDRAIADLARLGRLLPGDVILDTTFGLGRFWRRWSPAVLIAGDLDPARARDVVLDATALPFRDRAVDVVVFDPPYKLRGTPRLAMDEDYGVRRYVHPRDVLELILAGLREAARVARRVALIKVMDQVASSRQHWQTVDVHVEARRLGLEVVEELHVHAPVAQRQHGAQRHARERPSTFVVIDTRSRRR